jgi:hypothetical protein
MQKSWNQLYKESGTTLSYKEWRRREDEKMASFDGLTPSDSLKKNPYFLATQEKMKKEGGYKEDISYKTVFGIRQSVLVVGGLIVVLAIGIKLYQNYKNR